jgi:hypothetical protein
MRRAQTLILALLTYGCSDEAVRLPPPDGQTYEQPLYAIQSLTFGDQGSSTYVILQPDLAAGPDITLDDAREFAEFAPGEVVDGRVVIASGEAPSLSVFSVSDTGAWLEGGTLSLASFTSEALAANVPVSARKVYVPFDVTNHVTYDAETLELGTEVGAPSDIPLTRDGLDATRGYAHALRGSTLFQPYYFADALFDTYSETSSVAVIDVATDTLLPSFDVPCPHLHITTQDDRGNVYLSNGVLSVAGALLTPGHAHNCFARINAGENVVDPSSITQFRDLAGGREGSNLFYIGGGRALFNVYHAERDDLSGSDAFDVVNASNSYHLWTLDLATGEAAMLEGIDFSGGQVVTFRIDGRTLVTIPAGDYSSTQFYEVPENGPAQKLFDVEAWAYKVFRVR